MQKIDHLIRKKIKFEKKNKFEKIVSEIFLRNLPYQLLLGIHSLKTYEKVKYWIGSDIYFSQETVFKIAKIVENGGKWISCQHGGGYGQTLSFPRGKIEYETSDGFISWGWKHKHIYQGNIYPLPSPMLSKLPKWQPKTDNIILVSTAYPLYFYKLHSDILPEQRLEYINNRLSFLKYLKSQILLKLKYKAYFKDYGVDEKRYFKKVLKDTQFIKKSEKLTNYLSSSKINIIDHRATSFLESLAMNAPTVIFWNSEHFEIMDKVKPDFKELESVGIYHKTPESAANHVNRVYDNVKSWWLSKEVQDVREKFCYKYARTSKHYLKEWIKFVKNLD